MAGSLTADGCCDVIITATQDRQTARKYRDIIAKCEAANYSSVAVNVEAGQIQEVINLIRSIDKKAK